MSYNIALIGNSLAKFNFQLHLNASRAILGYREIFVFAYVKKIQEIDCAEFNI